MKTMRYTQLLLLAASLGAVAAHAKDAAARPQPAMARTLAAACTSCHGTDGKGQSTIPTLAGKQRAYLLEQLLLFKTDVLKVTLMNQLAKGFTDDELALLADFYSTQQ